MSTFVARVAGVGLACPLGLRSPYALAAINAGIVSVFERDDVLVAGGVARAAMLDNPRLASSGRSERAAFFVRHAITEALAAFAPAPESSLPCILALPEPGVGPRIDGQEIINRLGPITTRAGLVPRLALQHVVESGRAGVFEALAIALEWLARGHISWALVAGVDVLVDSETLRALASADRLLSMSNRDGIIPGEGAGCVLIGHPRVVDPQQSLGAISRSACMHEPIPHSAGGNRVSGAQGLATVFQSLARQHQGRVDEVFAGISSERYFGREFAHACLRSDSLMPEPLRCVPVCEALGDVGAAAGAISLVHAIARVGPERRGNRGVPNEASLAYASSDHGLVGGCVVTSPRSR